MGTLHYMAPEQTEHPQQVDHRADIYSLGVVFYQMLTGELPLGRFAPPSRKVAIDVRLDGVVLRALEKEPERRYQHVGEIKTQVESIAMTAPGKPPALGAAPAADLALARQEVRLPALGLLAAGVLNFLTIAVTGAAWGLISQYVAAQVETQSPLTAAEAFAARGTGVAQGVLLLVLLAGLIASGLTMFGALKMLRLEGYRAAVTAGILAMITSPGNLVGLPFGIWALVVLSSRSVKTAFARTAPPVPRPHAALGAEMPVGDKPAFPLPAASRLSRVAVAGAVWAPFFLFVVAATFVVVPVQVEAGAEPPRPAWWQLVMAATLLPLGLAAPLGTTICGGVAIAQIRHARDRLYGLGLAVFDLLLYPLLVLDLAIGCVVFAVLHQLLSQSRAERVELTLALPLAMTFLICVAVDALIVWLVWRAAKPKG